MAQREVVQIEKDIVVMSDPRPKFVSMVKRGANQEPWIVVKGQKEDGSMSVRRVLQAVVVPEGTDEATIRAVLGDEVDLNVKKTQGGFTSYELLSREVCKAESFELVDFDAEKGIRGFAAELVEESSNIVMKLLRPKRNPVSAIEIPAEIVATKEEDVQKAMSGMCYDEVYAMESAIIGVLSQSEGDIGTKMTTVKTLMDNCLKALQSAMSVAKVDATKMEMPEHVELVQSIVGEVMKAGRKISSARLKRLREVVTLMQDIIKEVEGSDGEEEKCSGLNKKKPAKKSEGEDDVKPEEIQAMIDVSLKPVVEKVDATAKTLEGLAGVADTLKSIDETLKAQVEAQKKQEDALKTQGEVIEAMKKQVPGTVVAKDADDVQKGDGKPVAKSEAEKSDDEVFKGVLFAELPQ